MPIILTLLVNLFIESASRKSIFAAVGYLVLHPVIFLLNGLIILLPYMLVFLTRRRYFVMAAVSMVWCCAGVVRKGKIYNVLGSSSWISMASDHPFYDDQMRTFNWIHLDPKLYTPCGTMQTAGMSYAWYRDAFCQLERKIAHEEQKDFYMLLEQGISSSPPGANGLLYLPYLLGERSPRWNVDARAAFIGIGISTSKEDMLRSVLEGVGYNLRVILELLEQIQPVKTITMIGGGVKSMVWRQILSDIYGKKLEFPQYLEEATSMGAAICAGVGIGIFADYSVAEKWNMVQSYQIPKQQNVQLYEELYRVFNKSYESLKDVFGELGTFRRNNTK